MDFESNLWLGNNQITEYVEFEDLFLGRLQGISEQTSNVKAIVAAEKCFLLDCMFDTNALSSNIVYPDIFIGRRFHAILFQAPNAFWDSELISKGNMQTIIRRYQLP
jgi:hypothetical protein